MDRRFSLRKYMQERRHRVKRIHKSWVGFGTGLKAVLKDLFIVFQLLFLAIVYAVLIYKFTIFYYVCLSLTALAAVHVLAWERDIQSKISWILLFLISFGCGFIIYILAAKPISYGIGRLRFRGISRRIKHVGTARENDGKSCGYAVFCGTKGKYYSNARAILDNLIARIDAAEKFVFLEFFIVADGVLLNRLLSIFRRKIAAGVQIYMLYDDVGSAGVFSGFMKKTLRDAGVHLKAFSNLFSPFYFGLNFRDHRKIVVVDGKTGYVGGYNMIDDCANLRIMEGIWKDSGLRLDGAAVDGLSVAFMRQWELATHQKLDYGQFLNNYESIENGAKYITYAGGPELRGNLCRNVYSEIIAGARERLYIMTPYLIPDTRIKRQLIKKVKEGVDVRLVLPEVPDYRYIYRVTVSNARRLMKRGVKVYYAGGEFVHSKVVLSESYAAVGSVNMDMRAFYQEFDNGVVTDDNAVLSEIYEDFDRQFNRNSPAQIQKINPLSAVIALILRLVSPLM